uniref:Uncharacterized protein n=1 Tax=Lepeophtheirus salmonis TaxID=72036 RepID=A0A0K2U128_LEPSM
MRFDGNFSGRFCIIWRTCFTPWASSTIMHSHKNYSLIHFKSETALQCNIQA